MDNIHDVSINNLVYKGNGIGRLADGRVVFVPFTMPGEKVRIRLIEEKPRFARAELLEVLEPAPQRITARCSHYTYCGGCHYQHMDYPAQLEIKSSILQEQLARIGGLEDIPPLEITGAASASWNYRNQIQFHLTHEGKLGFQRAQSNQTCAIRECHLPIEPIHKLWPQINIEPIPGLKRISIRSGLDGELMLVLESPDPRQLDFKIDDRDISVVQKGREGKRVLAGNDHITMEVLGKRFRVSAGSFFQVNTLQASALVRQILSTLVLNDTMTVLDVYCGVGLYSAFLAPKVKRLVGIEISPEACEDFSRNLDEYEHVSLYEAPAADVLSRINFNPEVILVDPPREGLDEQTMAGVLAQSARHLVYVSCDPATLARDAKRLVSGGYRLEEITLFDMFPQTYHIESVSYWRKS